MAKKKTLAVDEANATALKEKLSFPITLDALCIYVHSEGQSEDQPPTGPHSVEFRIQDKRFVRGKLSLNCESPLDFDLGEVYTLTLTEEK